MVIKHLDDAHEQLDRAIAAALRLKKPVYINIACNLGGAVHPTFARSPIPFSIAHKVGSSRCPAWNMEITIIRYLCRVLFLAGAADCCMLLPRR